MSPFSQGDRLGTGMIVLAAVCLPTLVSSVRTDGAAGNAVAWYVVEAERFERRDGATALYDATRRRAAKTLRGIGGS